MQARRRRRDQADIEDSEEVLLIALRDVAKAHRMSKIAEEAGVSRESIYRMLREAGNPRYSLLGILRALHLKLAVVPELPTKKRAV